MTVPLSQSCDEKKAVDVVVDVDVDVAVDSSVYSSRQKRIW